MMTSQQLERIQYLLPRYMDNQASAGELRELSGLLKSNSDNRPWQELLEEIYETGEIHGNMQTSLEPILEAILASTEVQQAAFHAEFRKEKQPAAIRRFGWSRIAAAAVLLIGVSVGTLYLFNSRHSSEQAGTGSVISKANDIPAPVKAKATITLSDGRVLNLDSLATGTLATQGNMLVNRTGDGQIAYQPSSASASGQMVYNTLTNPRGSTVISMTLADGSQVWLNAGSSLTYPVAFSGPTRSVAINGEAYFEVAHDASRPFFVSKGDMRVQVLGTHFNVNAYNTDNKITLLEGSVKVSTTIGERIIKPGEQAIYNTNTQSLITDKGIDLESVIAWKNGNFQFRDAGIEMIMQDIERWYDVDVVYVGTKPAGHYGGIISRQTSLVEVINLLSNGGIKTRIEGRKLIVE